MRRQILRTAVTAAALGAAVLAPVATAFAADGPAPAAASAAGEEAGTATLLDGLTGKIYKQGEHTYHAAVYRGDTLLGALRVTSDSGAIVKDYRVYGTVRVILSSDGTLTSQRAQAGDPAGEPAGTYRLEGGLTARVFEMNGTLFDATVHAQNGTLLGKLHAGTGSGAHPTDTKVFHGVRVTLHSDGKVTSEPADAGGDAKGTLVRTETLSDGSLLKIYQLSMNHYRAENIVDGSVIGTLDADGRAVAGQHNGLYMVLTPDGTTYHWTGNTVTGGKLGRYKLPNGKIVELLHKNGVYGLDAFRDGHSLGILWADGDESVIGQDDVTVVVLNPDGSFSNYIIGRKQQGPAVFIGDEKEDGGQDAGKSGSGTGQGTTPAGDVRTTTAQTTVVPRGAVAAGAELSTDGSTGDGDTVLVASGAGAAALAAAGLGFVFFVRRRTD
ncbi:MULTISPECIES: hypothetical protein [unclassified Streptomyces]|uniref:hypothetical protein n=1 Tax=unclassified Streptomyces TaxID=2593676 RepID=UPI003D713B85